MVAALIDTLYLAGKEEKWFFSDPSQDVPFVKKPFLDSDCSPTVEYPWREKCFNSTVPSGRAFKGIFRRCSVSFVLSTDP